MALDARHVYRVLLDDESHELIVVRGDVAGGNYEVLGPLTQFIRDREGNEVRVTEDGRLTVRAREDDPVPHAWAQLDAAGSTAWHDVTGLRNHSFQVKLANKDTSVTYRFEGTHDGTNPFNLDDSEVDTTKDANGIYQAHKNNFLCKAVRFTFVSEAGGAAATLDVTHLGGR